MIRSLMVLSLLALAFPSYSGADPRDVSWPPKGKWIEFEGEVHRGEDYRRDLGSGFTFSLNGQGPWTIGLVHESRKDFDLIYPMNPPYRSGEHLMIGAGYGRNAEASIDDFPRSFSFLYRPKDILGARAALEKVLWPKTDRDLKEGAGLLGRLPSGQGTMTVLSVHYGRGPGKGQDQEVIEELRFKVYLTWPKDGVSP